MPIVHSSQPSEREILRMISSSDPRRPMTPWPERKAPSPPLPAPPTRSAWTTRKAATPSGRTWSAWATTPSAPPCPLDSVAAALQLARLGSVNSFVDVGSGSSLRASSSCCRRVPRFGSVHARCRAPGLTRGVRERRRRFEAQGSRPQSAARRPPPLEREALVSVDPPRPGRGSGVDRRPRRG